MGKQKHGFLMKGVRVAPAQLSGRRRARDPLPTAGAGEGRTLKCQQGPSPSPPHLALGWRVAGLSTGSEGRDTGRSGTPLRLSSVRALASAHLPVFFRIQLWIV